MTEENAVNSQTSQGDKSTRIWIAVVSAIAMILAAAVPAYLKRPKPAATVQKAIAPSPVPPVPATDATIKIGNVANKGNGTVQIGNGNSLGAPAPPPKANR